MEKRKETSIAIKLLSAIALIGGTVVTLAYGAELWQSALVGTILGIWILVVSDL